LPETLFMAVTLLAMFYLLDSWLYRKEGVLPVDPTPPTDPPLGVQGRANFLLRGVVVALVLMSGLWKSSVEFDIWGTHVGLPGLVRDVGLVVVTFVSLAITSSQVHEDNQFSWGPMAEVAKLFAGIF